MMGVFEMVVAIVFITTIGGVLRRYLRDQEQARRWQATQLSADVTERLARLEARLAEMADEQRQLREEVDWQSRLLQRPTDQRRDVESPTA